MSDRQTPPAQTGAAAANRAYYEASRAGRDDYWRKMAAPRLRLATVLSLLEQLKPRSVVDLGCGAGAVLTEIAARLPTAALAGIDISSPQIERNRAAQPLIEWHTADLDGDTPITSELVDRFASVTALEVIEHLDQPRAFLRRAAELAAAGGFLILSTQSGRVGETERRVGHRRHYSCHEMSALLDDGGWQPLRVWNAGFPFHDLSKWYANRDPDASMKRFGEEAYGWSENLISAALRVAFRMNSKSRGAQLFAIARRRD